MKFFETEVNGRNYYFFYMGPGVREILMVVGSLEKGYPRRVIKTQLSFSSYEEFMKYHEGFFKDEECVKSFIEEFVNQDSQLIQDIGG